MGSRPGKQPSQAGVPDKPAIPLGRRPGRQPSQAGQAGQASQAAKQPSSQAAKQPGSQAARQACRLPDRQPGPRAATQAASQPIRRPWRAAGRAAGQAGQPGGPRGALTHRRRRCGIGSRQNPIVFDFGAQVSLRLDGPVFRSLQNKRSSCLEGTQTPGPLARFSFSAFQVSGAPPAPPCTKLRDGVPGTQSRYERLFCKTQSTPSPSTLCLGGGGGRPGASATKANLGPQPAKVRP